MHFHHRHGVDGCTDEHTEWPDWVNTILATIDRKAHQTMSALQDEIDALATDFAAALGDISAEIASLKAASEPSADLSGLDAALAQARALGPAPVSVDVPAADPAPIDPAPVDQPAPVDEQPADTGVIPAQSIPSVPLA